MKKILCFLLSAMLFLPVVSADASTDELVDVAEGKPCFATYYDGENQPDHLTDGDATTALIRTGVCYAYIDLGAPYTIEEIDILPYNNGDEASSKSIYLYLTNVRPFGNLVEGVGADGISSRVTESLNAYTASENDTAYVGVITSLGARPYEEYLTFATPPQAKENTYRYVLLNKPWSKGISLAEVKVLVRRENVGDAPSFLKEIGRAEQAGNDGNTGTAWTSDQNDVCRYVVTLDEASTIGAITYLAKTEDDRAKGFQIYVANDSTFSDKEQVYAQSMTQTIGASRFTYIDVNTTVPYKYVLVENDAARGLSISELGIYTTDPKLRNFKIVQEADGFNLSFQMLGNIETNAVFVMSFYDENGDYLGMTTRDLSAMVGDGIVKQIAFQSPAENAQYAVASMLESFDTMWVKKHIYSGMPDSGTDIVPREESGIEAVSNGTILTIKGKGNGKSVWLLVAKAEEDQEPPTDEQMEQFFNGLDGASMGEKLIKSHVVLTDEKGNFNKTVNFTGFGNGYYMVKAVYDKLQQDGTDLTYFYNMPEPDDKRIAGEISTAASGEMAELICDTHKGAFGAYADKVDALGDAADTCLEIARYCIKNGLALGEAKEITYIADVKAMIDLAVEVHKTLDTGLLNPVLFSNLVDEAYTSREQRFAAVFTELQTAITDGASFISIVERAKALSLFYNGTINERKQAITDYAEVLGVDHTLVTDDNAIIIAKGMGTSLDDVKSYATDINSAIQAAIDAAPKQTTDVVSGRGPGLQGGVVGVGGSMPSAGGTTAPIITPPAKPFSDLAAYEWAEDAINRLYKKGAVNGIGNGRFEPGAVIKREEAVKMLVKAYQITAEVTEAVRFSDCNIAEWYYPYIGIAKAYGIVSGESTDAFGIGKPVTRQDFCVMLYRILNSYQYAPSVDGYNVPKDMTEVAEYAVKAVSSMTQAGLISGYADHTFRPTAQITRAEAAVLIDRCSTLIEELEAAKEE